MTDSPDGGDVAIDVAIVGAGLVGRPLAVALSRQGWRVVLIDRQIDDAASALANLDELDQRCTALSAGSVDWLSEHGLWKPALADAHAMHQVHVSQHGFFGSTRIDARDADREVLGWTIENRRFTASLEGPLAECDVRVLTGRCVRSIDQQQDSVVLTLARSDGIDGSQRLQTRLLVIADGARSATAELLGIGSRESQHQQWASLTTVRTDQDHLGIARERFTDSGPLALLPRPGRVLSVVACHDELQMQHIQTLDDAGFLAWLAERMPSRSGRPLQLGPRTLLPLSRIESDRQHLGRSVLMGNAARLLHPVAGQGYNLALRDVATLVDALATTSDPGDTGVLETWLADRRNDQHASVVLTDGLARVFRGRNRVLGHARAGGLMTLDLVSAARRGFVRATTRGPLL